MKDWHAKAREMRAAGAGYRVIAEACGVTSGAAYKACNPERAGEYGRRENADPARKAAKRAWDRENDRGECEICGVVTWRRRTRCPQHTLARDAAWRRRKEIADRWAAGESLREIAEALGTSSATIGVEMTRMRRAGWDVPYRYNVKDRKRVAA